jgi:hypothetical protein
MTVRPRKLLIAALLAVPLLASPPPAHATTITFDDKSLHGGTITGTLGVNTAATGTNIIFDIITLLDDTNTTVAAVQCGLSGTAADACLLTFDTVANTITLTAAGGLYTAGTDFQPFTNDSDASEGTLIAGNGEIVLSGSFQPVAGVSTVLLPTAFIGNGEDQKSAALLEYFGVVIFGNFSFVTTDITINQDGVVTDAQIDNIGGIQLIPEPGMLTLVGVGLLGIGRRFAGRRQV